MKPIDIKVDYYIKSNGTAFNENPTELHFNKKILNLKLMIMLEFQNKKTFLLKDIP